MRSKVITIHGINTEGTWQEETVGFILGPFFEIIHIKYDNYRLGPIHSALRAVFNETEWNRTVAAARNTFEIENPPTRPCHLIAHSFGTAITGHLISTVPSISFRRVIYAGCALPTRFPWDAIITANPRVFEDLRNEVGGKDLVIAASSFAKFFSRRLGGAGRFGFVSDRSHYIPYPLAACIPCRRVPGPYVHNVLLRNYAHSDHFLRFTHARDLWLPYLWGFAPREFLDFIHLCRKYVALKKAPLEQAVVEHVLKNSGHGMFIIPPLERYLRSTASIMWKQRSDRLLPTNVLDAVVDASMWVMAKLIDDAASAQDTSVAQEVAPSEEIVYLDPIWASSKAVSCVLDTLRRAPTP